jgi:hypothetical protein
LKNRERKWKKKRRNNWNFWVQGKNVRLRFRKQLNWNSTDLIMDEIKTRLFMLFWSWHSLGGRRGRDRMIVEFTTTYNKTVLKGLKISIFVGVNSYGV